MSNPNTSSVTERKEDTQVGSLKGPTKLEPTVQQEAFLLHIMHVMALKEKVNKEIASLRDRQEKIKYIHEVMQDINNTMDDKGNLDITKNEELKQKFKDLKDLGVKFPEGKEVFNVSECKRVQENLQNKVDDMSSEDSTQMRKIQNYYTESEQSIMIVKHTMSSMDKPLRSMIGGIRGGG